MSSSSVRFKPIKGCFNDHCVSYLLQIDEFTFLLDCGLNYNCSVLESDAYSDHLKEVDAILLSHGTIDHIGALPIITKHFNLTCPVYATTPVTKMGQLSLYDFYLSRNACEDFELFSLDDVDSSIESINQLKFIQSVSLKGKGRGITITPFAAGHSIGGSIWRISKEGEDDIIYSVDYNNKKELHINGSSIETMLRPSLLISGSTGVYYEANTIKIKDRRTALINDIIKTLRSNGNYLLLSDTGCRLLEILQILNMSSDCKVLSSYNIVIFGFVSHHVLEFVKSHIEWTSDNLTKNFEFGKINPFSFNNITFCSTKSKLDSIPSPKLIISGCSELEYGLSRQILVNIIENPLNTIGFTIKPKIGSFGYDIYAKVPLHNVQLKVSSRVELIEDELIEYHSNKNKNSKHKSAYKNINNNSFNTNDFDDDNEDIDNIYFGIDVQNYADFSNPKINQQNFDYMSQTSDNQLQYLNNGQINNYVMTHGSLVHPWIENKTKWDDYGEILKPLNFNVDDQNKTEDKVSEEIKNAANNKIINLDHLVYENPTKIVTKTHVVSLKCNVSIFDFNGRADFESIQHMLTLIKPRQIIIIHGSTEETNILMNFCQQNISLINYQTIFSLKENELVDVTRDRNIQKVRLHDDLISKLSFSTFENFDIAWLEAMFVHDKTSDENPSLKTNQLLKPIDEFMSSRHSTVFVGDQKLSEFFKFINNQNDLCAVFGSNGSLIIGSNVDKKPFMKIQRDSNNNFVIEAVYNPIFYQVRNFFYNKFAMV